jgi:hypothetical protein
VKSIEIYNCSIDEENIDCAYTLIEDDSLGIIIVVSVLGVLSLVVFLAWVLPMIKCKKKEEYQPVGPRTPLGCAEV